MTSTGSYPALWPDPGVDDNQRWRDDDVEGMYERWLFTAQCLVKPLTPFDPDANLKLASRALRLVWLSHSGIDWDRHLRGTIWDYVVEQTPLAYEKYCDDERLRTAALSGTVPNPDLLLLWARATGADVDHTRGRFSDLDLSEWLGLTEGAIRVRYSRALERMRIAIENSCDD